VISPSCSCRTTPARSIARWPAAPARRSAAGSPGSPSSTRPATARAPPGRARATPRLEVSAPGPVHAGVDGETAEPNFLGERCRRLVKRRGKLKALVAIARSILVIVWHLLADPAARYQDLGAG
jgi:hypothetical protein